MKPLHAIISASLLFLCMASAHAQDNRENVELLIIDGSKAVFSSEGYGSDKRSAVESSQIAVLKRILYDGVQDFNGGYPIVKSGRGTNSWLRGLFDGEKNASYKGFLGDVEVVGSFRNSPTGESHCQTNVVVNYQKLLQYAESQGVTKEGSAQPPSPMPTEQQKPKKKSFLD